MTERPVVAYFEIIGVVGLWDFLFRIWEWLRLFIHNFFALIIAVKLVFHKGKRKLWFEVDSELALRPFLIESMCLHGDSDGHRWEQCLYMLEQLDGMDVRCSLIFREGHVPVEILSNLAL